MVHVPVRVGPLLASKLNEKFALPFPLALPAAMCSQVLCATAVHVAVAGVTHTAAASLPAAGPSMSVEVERE